MSAEGAVPALSVVMPTFNAEKHVAEAVNTILRQDFENFELLLVDDGSTDGTAAILQKLASDPRVRLLRNSQNMGLIATLHHAYEQCRAPLIARMDADDICQPARFRKQIAFLEANPQVAIVGGAIRFFGNVSPNDFYFPTDHEAIRVAMLFYCPLAHPALMFRRDLIDQGLMRYDDAFRHAEDYHLWSRLLLKVESANLNEVVLDYRLHAQQVSSDSSGKQYAASLRVRRQMLEECGLIPEDDEIALHESVILERPLAGADYMRKLARWFQRLEHANNGSGYWDKEALRSLLRTKFLETAQRTGFSLPLLAADPVAGYYVSRTDAMLVVQQPLQTLIVRLKRSVKALLRRIATRFGKH